MHSLLKVKEENNTFDMLTMCKKTWEDIILITRMNKFHG